MIRGLQNPNLVLSRAPEETLNEGVFGSLTKRVDLIAPSDFNYGRAFSENGKTWVTSDGIENFILAKGLSDVAAHAHRIHTARRCMGWHNGDWFFIDARCELDVCVLDYTPPFSISTYVLQVFASDAGKREKRIANLVTHGRNSLVPTLQVMGFRDSEIPQEHEFTLVDLCNTGSPHV